MAVPSMTNPKRRQSSRPFGEPACEHELIKLRSGYKSVFFEGTDFNVAALNPSTYLIIGRRGAGKSALAQYFTFQKEIENSTSITVTNPDEFSDQIGIVASKIGSSENRGIERIAGLWETIIWGLVFDHFRKEDDVIRRACMVVPRKRSASNLIKRIAGDILDTYIGQEGYLDEIFDEYILDKAFDAPRTAVLNITKTRPVIISIDSFERYDNENRAMMMSVAGLIQFARLFNLKYADRGIHIKIFVSAEIYPRLTEDTLLNTAKFVEDPVYLHWRPKELSRIICWRYHRYLEVNNLLLPISRSHIDWDDWEDVQEKMWNPYFGEEIENNNQIVEKTFPYILRHTQTRPRQLIKICNGIALRAMENDNFPLFSPTDIKLGINDVERDLAREVINSFARIYGNCGEIVQALTYLGPIFTGSAFSSTGKRTSGHWPSGKYSAQRFTKLVTELGIVGRVRNPEDLPNQHIEADFEYFEEDHLLISEEDKCVIHPMFYGRFNTHKKFEPDNKFAVYPFPDHPTYKDIKINR
jgi:hypothetical protein